MPDQRAASIRTRLAAFVARFRRTPLPKGPLCTCGEPATEAVAVEGLLCDEPGTTRTYTFCEPCARYMLGHYRGSEFLGSIGV